MSGLVEEKKALSGLIDDPLRSEPSLGESAAGLASRILAEGQDAERKGMSRLPNERQLASHFGVTRTAVRHALAILEASGKVTREVGRGTFIHAYGSSREIEAKELDHVDIGPADVMAVRRLVEPQAMALVVAWATARDLEEIDRCLAGGDAAETYEEFEAWDLALHRAIISASHNQLLVQIYDVIESARHGKLWGDLKRRNDSRGRRGTYQGHHAALVAALHDRDTDRAIEAMHDHLASVEADLFGHSGPIGDVVFSERARPVGRGGASPNL